MDPRHKAWVTPESVLTITRANARTAQKPQHFTYAAMPCYGALQLRFVRIFVQKFATLKLWDNPIESVRLV
jgi:hypothetical protein